MGDKKFELVEFFDKIDFIFAYAHSFPFSHAQIAFDLVFAVFEKRCSIRIPVVVARKNQEPVVVIGETVLYHVVKHDDGDTGGVEDKEGEQAVHHRFDRTDMEGNVF